MIARRPMSTALALLMGALALALAVACSTDEGDEDGGAPPVPTRTSAIEPDGTGSGNAAGAEHDAGPESTASPERDAVPENVEHHRLASVSRWLYIIDVDLEDPLVEQITSSQYEMVVLDFIPSEEGMSDFPMAGVVDRLHEAAVPKLVIAYIDIGQAEDYRTYWRPGWRVGDPDWIAGGDPDGWEGDFPVAFWRDEWREIWLGEDGYLPAIVGDGFDGVYLDWVGAYSDENVLEVAERDGVDARAEMIAFVRDIGDLTRGLRPGFIVIAQNAAELATSDAYLASIDAIAQEQIWFDGGADNDPPGDCPLPRTEADVDTERYRASLSEPCRQQFDEFPDSTLHVSSEEYLRDLTRARGRGELIFTVDYALDPENVEWVHRTSRALGFVPFAGSRALDGFVEPVP